MIETSIRIDQATLQEFGDELAKSPTRPSHCVFKHGLTPAAKKALVDDCKGIHKFDAIAKVALELSRQGTCMSARELCVDILNPAGHKTDRGSPFTGDARGPCKLVASAWRHFHDRLKRPGIADAIAQVFTDVYGTKAYE